MSLANELQKLKSLRDSGGITQDEYDKSRNRLLEECVRRIETVHDLNPKACVLGQQPTPPRGDGEPRVKFSRIEPRHLPTRPGTYSGELDYSLVKPPVQRVPQTTPAAFAAAPAPAVAEARIEPNQEARDKVEAQPPLRPVETRRMEEVAAVVMEAPARPAAAAVALAPARVQEERPAETPAPRVAISFSTHAVELDRKEPARQIEVFEREEAPAAPVAPVVRTASPTVQSTPSRLYSDAADLRQDHSAPQAAESDDHLVEEAIPRFGAYCDSKPSRRDRWGLPHFKMVRGVVDDIRISICQEDDRYAATAKVDGQRMAIASSSAIRVEAGDRISLAGYERDGEMMVLAYRNDTNGICSDLSNLQKRYRFLLTIGLLGLLAGLAALAGTLFVFTHKPVWALRFDRWGYVPYVLSGLAAVGTSYLGLTLSFVGRWAKEFHRALAPDDSSQEPAAYDASSLPLALE